MYSLSKDVCYHVLYRYFNSDQFEIIDFSTKQDGSASKGFLGGSILLRSKVKQINLENIHELTFFVKTLPFNKLMNECAKESGSFMKEGFFYNRIVYDTRKYLLNSTNKLMPNCYYFDSETIILENLSVDGYKTTKHYDLFDVDHCLFALKTLAEFHAIMFLNERESGITLDKRYSHHIFVSWYTDIVDKPGHKHLLISIKAIKEILNKYFINYPQNIREKFVNILKKIPEQLKPSKLYRNCLSHQDLWNNNIMFKYDEDNNVENAILIDFQLFAYNPPSLDVLMLIYLNTDQPTRENNLAKFFLHYYKHFCMILKKNNVDPNTILSLKDFLNSMCETLEPTLAVTITKLLFLFVPDDFMIPLITDQEKFKYFFYTDRKDFLLNVIHNCEIYKQRIFNVINDLFDYIMMDCNSKLVLNKQLTDLVIV